MDRTKQIQRRQAEITRGAIAETTLRDLESVFNDVERALMKDFIKLSKQKGDLDRGSGFRIIALDDVKSIFQEHINRGQKAAKARQKEIESQKTLEAVIYE